MLGREVAHVAFAAFVLIALVLTGVEGRLSAMLVGGAALFFVSRVAHIVLLWFAATHPGSLPRWRRLDGLRAHAPTFGAALRAAARHPGLLLRIAAWAAALDVLRVGWLFVALHAVGAGRRSTPRSRATGSSQCSGRSASCRPASGRSMRASSPRSIAPA